MLGPYYTNQLRYSIELIVLSVYYLTHVVTVYSLVATNHGIRAYACIDLQTCSYNCRSF